MQPVIEFAFRPRRTAQAAAWLLNESRRQVTMLELLKWLYFTDRRLLTEIGVPLTGDQMVSMDNGPVPSTTYDLVRGKQSGTEAQQVWDHYVRRESPDSNVLIANVPHPAQADQLTYDDLTPRQIETLGRIMRELEDLSVSQLVEYAHSVREWENPNGSSRAINPARILEVEHWSQEAITSVAKNAAANLAVDRLLETC
jgi:uncharacterized phage-associated protein